MSEYQLNIPVEGQDGRAIEAILNNLDSNIFSSMSMAWRIYGKFFGSELPHDVGNDCLHSNNIKEKLIDMEEKSLILVKLLQELNEKLFKEDD